MKNKFEYYFWDKALSKSDLIDLHMQVLLHQDPGWKDQPASADGGKATLKNVSQVKAIAWKYVKDILKPHYDRICMVNTENYGFSFWHQNDLEVCLHNTYDEKNEASYNWHYDGSPDFSHTYRLTVLINTSLEKYEGGQLELFTNGGVLKVPELNNSGSIVIFRAEMLHRVTPVTKGTRHSLAFFIKGPKYI